MPRTARGHLDEGIFHIINRGNGRATVFKKDSDYRAFVSLLGAAKQRIPTRVFAFCLMPNHFHMVAQSVAGGMSAFIHWLLTTHVRRYHVHYGTTGHVWQGRFKSFEISQDEHFLTVVRYVVSNPVRAGLVSHPSDWRWSSLRFPAFVDPWPVTQPSDWPQVLARALPDEEVATLRASVVRQVPFGRSQRG